MRVLAKPTRPLEEVVIEGPTRNMAVLFDEATANNVWGHLMGGIQPDANGKINYDDGDLEMIARHLIGDVRYATINSKPTEIGENTLFFKAGYDFTRKGKLQHRKAGSGEVYMVIPRGAVINGKKNSERVVKRYSGINHLNLAEVTEFLGMMRGYGYTQSEAVQIYRLVNGLPVERNSQSDFQTPHSQSDREKKWGAGKLLLAAAIGAALAYVAFNGVDSNINSPKFKAQVEEAARIPGSNVYCDRFGNCR